MFKITDSAADVLRQVRTQAQVPDTATMRIQLVPDEGMQREVIGVAFTEEPEAEDQAVAEDPKVFVAGDLAAPLATAVLDTLDTGEGTTELQLRQQQPEDGQV